jgi:alpha-galactosidase
MADDLPLGLAIDRQGGLITGKLKTRGQYLVRLRVRNRLGVAEKAFTIVVGDEIALTPPMGWNSWNCWGLRVSEEKVRAAARALVTSGLRDHGWSYVNIDDGWQGQRGGRFQAIQPNPKFPDMPGLTREIHQLGLKAGIYSTPWRVSSGLHLGSSADNAEGGIETTAELNKSQYQFPNFHSRLDDWTWLRPLADWRRARTRKQWKSQLNTFGKFSFVRQDVRQWADWEMDYLKYDWVPIDLPHTVEMSREIHAAGRDIVYSVSNNAKANLAPELAQWASAWRIAVDLNDTWESVSDIGFSMDHWAKFNRPGHYNDSDMLVLGRTKWSGLAGCRLSSDEQYAHMSLWCLISGPLLLGCDLGQLDPFTLGLLTNDEVLAINQDALCHRATRIARSGHASVLAKSMEDGSWAVGLFNLGRKPIVVGVEWSQLGLTRPGTVRDLWRQQDLGAFPDRFTTLVNPHGVVLIRVTPSDR